tara:strand:+ start:266 stop:874 length:609 start_codon:yes stop_codon:yes gene_type:complete
MKSKESLKVLKTKLKLEWAKYLKDKGVKFPNDSQRLNGILCLFENIGQPLTQDEVLQWFELNDLPKYDRQLRHIADDGWYIVGGNTRATRYEIDTTLSSKQLCLKSIKKANPKWVSGNTKRKNFLDSDTWEKILKTFIKRGCAVCGKQFKNYDKGHLLNGAFDSYEQNNIVPMCSSCNNWGQMYDLEFKLDDSLRARPIIEK